MNYLQGILTHHVHKPLISEQDHLNFSWGCGDCFQFTSKFWIPFRWVRGPMLVLFSFNKVLVTICLYALPQHPTPPPSWSHHNETLRKSKYHIIWRGDWVATKHYITWSFIPASCIITLGTYFLMFCQAPSLSPQVPNRDFPIFFISATKPPIFLRNLKIFKSTKVLDTRKYFCRNVFDC